VAAVAVSLLLHALIGTGLWSHFHRDPHGLPTTIVTQVDGPREENDAGEMKLVLREPAEIRIVPGQLVPPQTLPPLDVPPVPLREPVIPVAAQSQSQTLAPPVPIPSGGTSTAELRRDSTNLKADGVEPLHGRLKPGQSIVYLVDRSSSMSRGKAWVRAIEAIRASLAQLDPECRFDVVAYNGGTMSFARGLTDASEDNRRKAIAWLERLIPEGGSDHVAGFREAIHRQSDVVVLLTDADDLDATEIRRMDSLIHNDVMVRGVLFASPTSAENGTPLADFLQRHRGSIRFRP
jgi:von Willebrand factor type A domain